MRINELVTNILKGTVPAKIVPSEIIIKKL